MYMYKCKICNKPTPSKILPCVECSKKDVAKEIAKEIHEGIEKIKRKTKIKCDFCDNKCGLKNNESGLCKLRFVENNQLKSLVSPNTALAYYYEDPLPTNCCNAWFCEGSKLYGKNLAIFYYGCNFDCLYCQNYEHKFIESASKVEINEILKASLKEEIKCVCHFGGSPEPQLPFSINLSKKILEKRKVMICWEWNGAGNPKLVLKAAEISYESNGTVKFDLKAWNENLHFLLTGRDNKRVLKNFEMVFSKFPEVISATTLLVPYYVDKDEVENIAKFISSFSEKIPYSLLIFHPAYKLKDLPITPKKQVFECYKAAKKYLKNVYIGNLHLLSFG